MEEDLEIPVGNYILTNCIGKGSFSSVWVAEAKFSDSMSAVKVVPKKTVETPELLTRFKREVTLLEQANHPFITHFYELVEDSRNYYVFMEYAENGDFGSFIERRQLSEHMCRYFFTEIVLAIDYLHNTCRIAHRDLKPDNILLDRYNNIRISDFGLSNTFSDVNPTLNSTCGSPAYAAPEIAHGKPYTKAADVWSLGVILYQMTYGELPFQANDIKTLLLQIISAEPKYPSGVNLSLINLMKRMLCKNPNERITIKEILQHDWLVPKFVEAVSNSVEKLKGMMPTDTHTPDYAKKVLEARTNLVYDISSAMNEARKFLPTASHMEPPHSLPSHKTALLSQLFLDDESGSEKSQKQVTKKKVEKEPPRKLKNEPRMPSLPMISTKKRHPIRVPQLQV